MSLPVAITFHPDGTATTLHTDLIPLQDLGHCRTRRVSWIDFNEHTQQWEVRFDPHAADPVFTHTSRQECILWEHHYFLEQSLP
jgi:hypothetical protein